MSKKQTSVVFTGDIGYDRYMEGKWTDEEFFAPEILEFFHNADHVCANVEGAVVNLEPGVDPLNKGMFLHTINVDAVRAFNKIEADFWNLANNHSMDAGDIGIKSTLKLAAENNVQTIGAGLNVKLAAKPAYINEAGGIGMVGCGYRPTCYIAGDDTPGCLAWDDLENLGESIKEIKSKCRWCVVVVHGGEEFNPMPSPYTRDLYKKYLELGADVVIGHHPHVPENYEIFPDGKIIFYSLGNFIFDTDYQRAQMNTDKGVLVKLIFTEDTLSFEALGTKLIRGIQRLEKAELPAIFENVSAEEYERLIPLGEKAFVCNEKRKKIFLKPSQFNLEAENEWQEYFFGEAAQKKKGGRHMDLITVCEIAAKAENNEWKESPLEGVKKYLLEQIF